jgi:hypothetical protein
MKLYRFAVHPEEDGYLFLECINDPKLFTQARSMDEALLMCRDVVACMYEIKGVIIELVVPPDVVTRYEQKRSAARQKKPKRSKRSSVVTTTAAA